MPVTITDGALPYEHLTRQRDLLPPDKTAQPITLIGCGAIGSFTALALAKMGFSNLTLYDFDEVDTVNLSSQFYRHSDIGKNKAQALAEMIFDFTKEEATAVPTRWGGQPLSGVVIVSVDNMETRAAVAEAVLRKNLQVPLLVDPRMGAETALCYTANPMHPDECARYEKSLYPSSEAVRAPCTAKATMYTVLGIAGHLAAVVRDFAVGRPVPFFMTWDMRAYDQTVFLPAAAPSANERSTGR